MNYTVVINSAVWGGALAYYYIDARKWFTGPKITIDAADLTGAQHKAIVEDGLEILGLEGVVGKVGTEGSGNGNGNDMKKAGQCITFTLSITGIKLGMYREGSSIVSRALRHTSTTLLTE